MPGEWPWRRIGVLIGAAALLVAFVLTLPITLTPGLRTRLTAALSERFDSDVEIKTLRVSVLPRARVAGEGIVLRHKGRTDVPPLITIASFSADANLFRLLGSPLRLRRVHLEGLEINVPPGGLDIGDQADARTGSTPPQPGDRRAGDGLAPEHDARDGARSPLIVDDLLSERAVLRILRGDPDKHPRVFDIHHLSMQGTGSHEPWAFRATLTNPTPPGEIETEGTFGPWHAGRPALTPLDARFEFRNADLGVFDGIRGTLQSAGRFTGMLERIEVDGRADVPGFMLEHAGQAVPLETRFRSIVDATNGNTWLKPVTATLLGTAILASGGVVERPGERGRTVTLDVVIDDGRVEDVLRLAVKAKQPAMTGALKLKTKVELPPGPGDAVQKLRLDGSFELGNARFTAGDIQARLSELSQKAVGDSKTPQKDVVSDFTGAFVMRAGVIRFSSITFSMPGTRVDLAGRYTVASEALDFRGTVRLQAKLSELTTGAKSFLLKLVDPVMRRRNVTVVPITIRGTAEDPKFGLDVRRTLLRQ